MNQYSERIGWVNRSLTHRHLLVRPVDSHLKIPTTNEHTGTSTIYTKFIKMWLQNAAKDHLSILESV